MVVAYTRWTSMPVEHEQEHDLVKKEKEKKIYLENQAQWNLILTRSE